MDLDRGGGGGNSMPESTIQSRKANSISIRTNG